MELYIKKADAPFRAIQYTGNNLSEIIGFMQSILDMRKWSSLQDEQKALIGALAAMLTGHFVYGDEQGYIYVSEETVFRGTYAVLGTDYGAFPQVSVRLRYREALEEFRNIAVGTSWQVLRDILEGRGLVLSDGTLL